MNDASLGKDGQHCCRLDISLHHLPIYAGGNSRFALLNWLDVETQNILCASCPVTSICASFATGSSIILPN